MESIADAALTGARGNSGIIFAQFLNGIHNGLTEEKKVSLADFSKAVNYGINQTYESISNPVEGTIITVMYDWSKSINLLKDRATDVAQLFSISLEVAVQSLNAKTDKLKALKDALVVDAGGKGFVYFLEGMTSYFMSPENNVSEYIAAGDEYEDHNIHVSENDDLSYRYCTKILLKGTQMELESIKSALQDYGDSLIVAGGPTRVRIHIHTNTPAVVLERLRGFGNVVQQMVDDMQRQFETVHARKYKIALVTDSIADLPKEAMDNYQVHMIPLNLLIGTVVI
ncbi:DAK2 domain-containing protein [Psychrobacillus sp.]|uniref:DAK2 domain-containing protein n=1 Tax=Psychrobacillus sp. TaxID=1871623 RepID=UPI0028BE5CCC|nr:DAK2 domain-containing protein [Psychrobacillus sp.]